MDEATGAAETDGGESRVASPDDRQASRVPESGWRFWLLLDGDRRVVAGVLLAVVLCAQVLAGQFGPEPALVLLTNGDPVQTLFQALVAATITSVTLVLTLGQLVLGQELGALGDQRERMEGSLSFRRDVEGYIDPAVSPAEPSAFLRAIVAATGDRARSLVDAVEAAPATELSGDARDTIQEYGDAVATDADEATAELEGSSFGEFDVVWAALDVDYSWMLYAGRRLQADHGDALPAAARGELAALFETLELFGPAREHVKTLYFQWELADLSRVLLYAAVPALIVAMSALLFLDPAAYPGETVGVSHALVLVALASTIAVSPFALLLAYVLRIVTVTKRTLSIGPFILREMGED